MADFDEVWTWRTHHPSGEIRTELDAEGNHVRSFSGTDHVSAMTLELRVVGHPELAPIYVSLHGDREPLFTRRRINRIDMQTGETVEQQTITLAGYREQSGREHWTWLLPDGAIAVGMGLNGPEVMLAAGIDPNEADRAPAIASA